ncbi:hypothetical protein M8410_15820, partial [Staphylococcus aureus]|uniref:hypothetical protein n=1 Tax=Staphylococcus aureus TaxID=1280 RepID=UPI00202041F5
IDNATTVAGVTAAQNTANELNTAMGQLQNGINDQNTVKQQVNSAKSALNGDEKLAAAKQTAKSDIGRLTDLNNAQRTAANA